MLLRHKPEILAFLKQREGDLVTVRWVSTMDPTDGSLIQLTGTLESNPTSTAWRITTDQGDFSYIQRLGDVLAAVTGTHPLVIVAVWPELAFKDNPGALAQFVRTVLEESAKQSAAGMPESY